MADNPLRTKSGAPSAAARKQYGMDDGSFPVFDQKSANDALRLRGQVDDPRTVINHVARQARKLNIPGAADAVAQARKEERRKK